MFGVPFNVGHINTPMLIANTPEKLRTNLPIISVRIKTKMTKLMTLIVVNVDGLVRGTLMTSGNLHFYIPW
jgi:hypothetical protein